MKLLLHLSLIIGLTISPFRLDAPDIREDMVHFDQAFIPLWFYVYEGNLFEAKSAVFYTEFQWKILKDNYQRMLADEEWQATFQRVDDWLGDAYLAIDSNEPQMALSQLEHVKYELQELRRRYEVEYYLDHLYRFQEDVEVLTETSNDDMLCLMGWPEFEDLAEAVLQRWRTISLIYFDPDLYGLDVEEQKDFEECKSALLSELENFVLVVESADREAIAAASWQVEAAFLPLLQLFGRFQHTEGFYVAKLP